MKMAISVPDSIFKSAERLASRLRVSRSELYAKALQAFLEKHGEGLVTSRLNEIYGPGTEGSSLEARLASMQTRSVVCKRRSICLRQGRLS